MSNLVDHAKRELRIVGYTGTEPEGDPNRWMYDNIVSIMETFASGGHSGASAYYAIDIVGKLMAFENLTPLTNNPLEWNEVGPDMWQNVRNSKAFSHDAGETYTLLDEAQEIRLKANDHDIVSVTHRSRPWRELDAEKSEGPVNAEGYGEEANVKTEGVAPGKVFETEEADGGYVYDPETTLLHQIGEIKAALKKIYDALVNSEVVDGDRR